MDRIWGLLQIIVIGVVGLIALKMLKPRIVPQPAMAALEGPAGETPLSAQSPEMLALAERAADGDDDAMRQLEVMNNGDQPLLDQEIALAQVDGRIKLSALKRIGDAIHASPPEAASVIRQWMNS
jgi:flagellar M-ring protein FliF